MQMLIANFWPIPMSNMSKCQVCLVLKLFQVSSTFRIMAAQSSEDQTSNMVSCCQFFLLYQILQPVTLPFSCDTSHCAYGLDCFTGLLRCCLNVTTCRPPQASLALGVSNSLLTKKNNSIIGFAKATMCLMFETPSVLPKKRTPPKTETLLYYHVFQEVSRSEMLRVWTDLFPCFWARSARCFSSHHSH